MSEPTFIFEGPPEGWTPADIQNHRVKLGLEELPQTKERIYAEIERQMAEGEKWGFDTGRLYYIRRLQDQYENGSWAFHNASCPHCWRSDVKCHCLLIWRTKTGYMTSQCGSAMIDYSRTK
jgi:hypothetical protein